MGGAPRRRRVLDRPGRDRVPRRQPPHQAVRVLGVADRPGPPPRTPRSIFLAEAFTRPEVMHRLAQVRVHPVLHVLHVAGVQAGAASSTSPSCRTAPSVDEFRANVWPTTPDILPWHLQDAPLEAFAVRLVLAATLSPSYGVYGPGFELGEQPRRPATARRSSPTPRSTRSVTGTSTGPLAAPADRPAQPDPHRATGPAHDPHAALPRRRQRRSCSCYSKTAHAGPTPTRRRRTVRCCASSTSIPVPPRRGIARSRPRRSGRRRHAAPYQVHDLLGGQSYTWHGGTLRRARPDEQPGAHLAGEPTAGRRPVPSTGPREPPPTRPNRRDHE